MHVCIHVLLCVTSSACLCHTYRTAEAQKSAFKYRFMFLDKRWCYAVCSSAECPSLECSVEFSDNAVECVWSGPHHGCLCVCVCVHHTGVDPRNRVLSTWSHLSTPDLLILTQMCSTLSQHKCLGGQGVWPGWFRLGKMLIVKLKWPAFCPTFLFWPVSFECFDFWSTNCIFNHVHNSSPSLTCSYFVLMSNLHCIHANLFLSL